MKKHIFEINKFKAIFAIVLIMGFIFRLYFLIKYGNNLTLNSDDNGYVNSAKALIETGVFRYSNELPTVSMMPGFVFFLSFMMILFGFDMGLITARFVQIIVSLIGIVYIYKLCNRIYKNQLISLIPAALFAFYPPSIITPNLLITEALFTTLMTMCCYYCIIFLERPSIKISILLGLIFAVTLYIKPVIVLVPVFICLYFMFNNKEINLIKKFTYCAVWALILILCMTPWWIRNYIVFERFIPLAEASGNPLLTGTYVNYEGLVNAESPDWPKCYDEQETELLQKDLALKRIKEGFSNRFWDYLYWYTIGKSIYQWKWAFDWYKTSEMPDDLYKYFHYYILFTSFVGLIIILIKRKLSIEVGVMLLYIAYNTIIYMIHCTCARYCYPQLPLVIVFSGMLYLYLFETYKRKHRGKEKDADKRNKEMAGII